jgi:D-glycero-alpha-D-manno-heptose 1-phosphate guanylyltransferase
VTTTCIVLAGGLGTRLRSAVADRPKCLAPVGPRPFIDIQIDSLLAAGVDEVVLSLGYMADSVVAAVPAGQAGRPVRHVVEPALLGTGGAIAYAMDALGLDEVLVANGDTYLSGDIAAMLRPLARAAGELFRMAVVQVSDRSRFGGVQVGAGGRVGGFLEKGQQGAGGINAGLYRLCRAALPAARAGAYSLEAEILPGLVAQGAVTALAVAGEFTDIGVPEDYFRFCAAHGG